MRYVISKASSVGAVAHRRNELPNALWIAMNYLDEPGDPQVTIRDTVNDNVIEGQAIRDLAARTPAWQNSSFDTPDA